MAVQYGVRPGPRAALARALRERKALLMGGVVLANLPDVDYVPGVISGEINAYHHLYTHTIGWVLVASAAAWLVWRFATRAANFRDYLFVLAVLGSHLALDWVSDDGRPPFGIMAFWPITGRFFISSRPVFWRLLKTEWADVFQWHNVGAVGVELLVCLPVLFLILFFKLRATPEQKKAASVVGNARR